MVNKAWELRCIEDIERDIADIEIDIEHDFETHSVKDNNCSSVLGSGQN